MIGLRHLTELALAMALILAVALSPARAQPASNAESPEAKALDAQFHTLFDAGKYAEAIPLAERYLAEMRPRVGEAHPDFAAGLSNLARALRGANRFAEAEAAFRRAIAADEAALGPAHADLAVDLGELVTLLVAANRLDEAEPLMRRTLAINEANLGPDHAQVGAILNALGQMLKVMNRLAEAEPIMRRALAIAEARLGATHAEVAVRLNNLGALLITANRPDEAEPLMRRALAIDEANLGPDHAQVGDDLRELGQLLKAMSRLAEAEPIMRRALAIAEARLGATHAEVAVRLNNLGALLIIANRLDEAEPLMRRALAIDEANLGRNSTVTAGRLGDLAQLLIARNALAEAEPMLRETLAVVEAQLGPNHSSVAIALDNLGALLITANRPAEAEPLIRRALAIDEAAHGPNHQNVATHLNNLAYALLALGRLPEAEPVMRRALAIDEALLGPNHPNVATILTNLSALMRALNRPAESEPMLRRALAIHEAHFSPAHPNVTISLNNLAILLNDSGRADEAEAMMRRVVAGLEQGLGPDHPKVAMGLENLAQLLAERGDWAGTVPLLRRSSAIRAAAARRNSGGSTQALRRLAQDSLPGLKVLVLALFNALQDEEAAREGFLAAQRALATQAASALAEASARFAAGSDDLAAAVRESQDAARDREAADAALLAAIAKGDNPAADAARGEEARLAAQLDANAARLAKEFPEYADLANPEPLSIEAVQEMLRPNEAVVQFIDINSAGKLPENAFAWAITKTDARMAKLGTGTLGLTRLVQTMRCGLDSTNWANPTRWPEATEDARQRKARQKIVRDDCIMLTGRTVRERDLPPFDLARAHELYVSLFGPIADLIAGKQLLIVPSGPLTTVPFQALVTEAPAVAIPQVVSDYGHAAWLGQQQAITVLPSIASLEVLRKYAKASKASDAFAGFGNPLLTGPYGTDDSAATKQACMQMVAAGPADSLIRGVSPESVAGEPVRGAPEQIAGPLANLDMLQRNMPLPETADELCAVSASLGAPVSAVHLAKDATEAIVKQLSASGVLRKARVLHFATHGLMPAETQTIAPGLAEPALVLTPPASASPEDDGLLTAAEVTQLNLDADWVVLSACNTAAAGQSGEDLSGLARAFFYAGARALLVSHWAVESAVTVALITRTFAALRADPAIGRAEALRRAVSALITEGHGMEHPAQWAPFVVVGEGAAAGAR